MGPLYSSSLSESLLLYPLSWAVATAVLNNRLAEKEPKVIKESQDDETIDSQWNKMKKSMKISTKW